jgi:hypothetical protein
MKYTKSLQNIPHGSKLEQMAEKIPTSSMERPSKIYPNWYFWPENMSSGNPG